MPETADDIRRRLVEINDERRELPADAFAAKYELDREIDRLRGLLAELEDPGARAVGERWAERAGRKGSHAVDSDLEKAKAAIPSPLHSN